MKAKVHTRTPAKEQARFQRVLLRSIRYHKVNNKLLEIELRRHYPDLVTAIDELSPEAEPEKYIPTYSLREIRTVLITLRRGTELQSLSSIPATCGPTTSAPSNSGASGSGPAPPDSA